MFPISGAEVILGILALEILGPIITDYEQLNMQFIWQGTRRNLQGLLEHNIIEISSTQLKCMHNTKDISAFDHFKNSPLLIQPLYLIFLPSLLISPL